MRTEDAMTAEVVELLRTLIRNACVNDGTDASGHEIRSADTLEAYLSGVGLAMERSTAAPGRVSLVTRIDGRDRRAPTLLLLGHTVEALGLDPAITAALTDPERVLDAARWLDSPGLARVVHACTHTTLSPNV